MVEYPKITNKTKLELSKWSFNKLSVCLQGLKALCQKEKATKSAQAHVSVSITDIVTGGDALTF